MELKSCIEDRLKNGESVKSLLMPNFSEIISSTKNLDVFAITLEALQVLAQGQYDMTSMTDLQKGQVLYEKLIQQNAGTALVAALETSQNFHILKIICQQNQNKKPTTSSTSTSTSTSLESPSKPPNDTLTLISMRKADLQKLSSNPTYKGVTLIGYNFDLGQLIDLLSPSKDRLEYLKLDKVTIDESLLDHLSISIPIQHDTKSQSKFPKLTTFIWNLIDQSEKSIQNVQKFLTIFFNCAQNKGISDLWFKSLNKIHIKNDGQTLFSLSKSDKKLIVGHPFFHEEKLLNEDISKISCKGINVQLDKIPTGILELNLNLTKCQLKLVESTADYDLMENLSRFNHLTKLIIDNHNSQQELYLNLYNLLSHLKNLEILVLCNMNLIGQSIFNYNLIKYTKLIILYNCTSKGWEVDLSKSKSKAFILDKENFLDKMPALNDQFFEANLNLKEFFNAFQLSDFVEFQNFPAASKDWGI